MKFKIYTRNFIENREKIIRRFKDFNRNHLLDADIHEFVISKKHKIYWSDIRLSNLLLQRLVEESNQMNDNDEKIVNI